MIKTIERLKAVMTVIVAVLVLSACSGDNGENPQEIGEGSASSVEIGGSSNVGKGGSSAQAGSSIAEASGPNSGSAPINVAGSAGSVSDAGAPPQGGTSTAGGGSGGDPQPEAGASTGGTSSGGSSSGGSASAGSAGATPGGSSSGGSGNTGGAASAGSSSGGSNAGGGGSAGSGNTAGSAGSGGSGGQPPVMKSFSCNEPKLMLNSPGSDPDATSGELWASSVNDIYVPGGIVEGDSSSPDKGWIMHWNGSNWVKPTLPVANGWVVHTVQTVWGSGPNDVWVGGSVKKIDPDFGTPTGNPRAKLWHGTNGGSVWQDMTAGLSLNGWDNFVRSISGWDADNVFVMVNNSFNMAAEDVKIFRKDGNVWTEMLLPAHDLPTRMVRLNATSIDDVYAVGAKFDGAQLNLGTPLQGRAWNFDGSDWFDLNTVPSDVAMLWGVSGADGEAILTGWAENNAVKHGVTLVSNGLDLDRTDHAAVTLGAAVWMPRIGAALIAEAQDLPLGGQATWFSVMSKDVVGNSQTMSDAGGLVSDVRGIPGSKTVLLLSQRGVLTATCQ